MEYSNMVLQIRAKLNITQQELAELLNVNFATVNRWENGRRRPSKRYVCMLIELCEEYNIDYKVSLNKWKS